MKPVTRYHPFLVTLHWILAVLIIAMLLVGFGLARTPSSNPAKIEVLQWHMVAGMLILALTIVRLIVRWRTSRPGVATTGHPVADRLAPVTHYSFYVLVILMAGTGYATALIAGLPEIVFARSGAPLPPTFVIYPTRVAHGYIAALLAGLIALHVLAALYHHFVRHDGLFRRMFYGQRAR